MAFVAKRGNRYLKATSTCTGFPDRHWWTTDVERARRWPTRERVWSIPNGAHLVEVPSKRSEIIAAAREQIREQSLQHLRPGDCAMACVLLKVAARKIEQGPNLDLVEVLLDLDMDLLFAKYPIPARHRIINVLERLNRWITAQLAPYPSYQSWLVANYVALHDVQYAKCVRQANLDWIAHMRAQLRPYI